MTTNNIKSIQNKILNLASSEMNNKLFNYNKFLNQNSISDSRTVLVNAVNAVKPVIGVVKTRIRGRAQYIPKTIKKSRQISLALRWFCRSSQEHKQRVKYRTKIKNFSVSGFIVLDILKAAHGIGYARRIRNDFYKTAEANRALLRKR